MEYATADNDTNIYELQLRLPTKFTLTIFNSKPYNNISKIKIDNNSI